MRKPLREVRIDSAEDLEALPEGEWVSVPGGFNVPLVFNNLVTIDGVQYVPLPPSPLHRLKSAVIERIRTRRSRRHTERAQ